MCVLLSHDLELLAVDESAREEVVEVFVKDEGREGGDQVPPIPDQGEHGPEQETGRVSLTINAKKLTIMVCLIVFWNLQRLVQHQV